MARIIEKKEVEKAKATARGAKTHEKLAFSVKGSKVGVTEGRDRRSGAAGQTWPARRPRTAGSRGAEG